MGHGLFKAYSFTMGAAAGSASIDVSRAFSKVYLQVPTFASTTALDVYASPDGIQTYYQLSKEVPNTTTVQAWSFTIAASAMAGGRLVPLPAGVRFYKIIAADSAPAGALGFQMLCSDS
jgi:hypothetical protein